MYLLNSFFGFDLIELAQPLLRLWVVIICFLTVAVLLSYKRGKSKFRFFPSLLAYALTLAMVSDPFLILMGHYKPVDFTEILGRSYILAILIAHRGNVMGPFKCSKFDYFKNLITKISRYRHNKKIDQQKRVEKWR